MPSRRKPRRPARNPSGRFVVRIDPHLHQALRSAARESGVSLNQYCARRLATPESDAEIAESAGVVGRALSLFGNQVLGIVVFGSWVRGQAGATSDIDVLIVIDSRLPVARDLYRRWDEVPVTWDGRPVEPHFVHLPEPSAVTGGVWAEVALDGLVLFERDFSVSRRLAAVRHDILSGRLVRRLLHGQPYWAEVA